MLRPRPVPHDALLVLSSAGKSHSAHLQDHGDLGKNHPLKQTKIFLYRCIKQSFGKEGVGFCSLSHQDPVWSFCPGYKEGVSSLLPSRSARMVSAANTSDTAVLEIIV